MELYPDFDCDNCSAQKKVDRGCEEETPYKYWKDLEGNEQNRCPRRPILENPRMFNTVIRAYNQYQAGYLPHSGGIQDQHCMFPILMGLMQSTLTACGTIKDSNKKSKNTPAGHVSLLHK